MTTSFVVPKKVMEYLIQCDAEEAGYIIKDVCAVYLESADVPDIEGLPLTKLLLKIIDEETEQYLPVPIRHE